MACSIKAPPPERSLQVVVLGEPLQRDVDRALQLLRGGVHEVGEDSSFGRLPDISRILRREQRNHGTAGFADDLLDQLERVLRGEAEPYECDVRVLSRRHCSHCRDVDFSSDHLVPEPTDDLGEQLQAVAPLVRDQDAQALNFTLDHLEILGQLCVNLVKTANTYWSWIESSSVLNHPLG